MHSVSVFLYLRRDSTHRKGGDEVSNSGLLAEELRAAGHRLTGPRRLVWTVLTEAGGHLTVEEIAERVGQLDPTVNLSSVYRSLALFAELGLARESTLGAGPASRSASHWEPAHPDEQFHLICESCGDVQHHAGDLVARIRSHLADEHDFGSNRVEVLVTGLCSKCKTR